MHHRRYNRRAEGFRGWRGRTFRWPRPCESECTTRTHRSSSDRSKPRRCRSPADSHCRCHKSRRCRVSRHPILTSPMRQKPRPTRQTQLNHSSRTHPQSRPSRLTQRYPIRPRFRPSRPRPTCHPSPHYQRYRLRPQRLTSPKNRSFRRPPTSPRHPSYQSCHRRTLDQGTYNPPKTRRATRPRQRSRAYVETSRRSPGSPSLRGAPTSRTIEKIEAFFNLRTSTRVMHGEVRQRA